MIVPLPKSQTRHPARAQAPLHLPHAFWTQNLQNPPPVRIFLRLLGRPISARKQHVGS